jgi:hypothetical protein
MALLSQFLINIFPDTKITRSNIYEFINNVKTILKILGYVGHR